MVGKSVICIPIKQKNEGILECVFNRHIQPLFYDQVEMFDCTFKKSNFQ